MRAWHLLPVGVALLSVAACSSSDVTLSNSTPDPISQSFDIRLQEVTAAAGLDGPMDLQAPSGDPRLFIAERPGRIRIVQNGALLTVPFLDISSRVFSDPNTEAGFLSFAFDPQFSTNKFVYVHFIENIPNTFGDIVVERYKVSTGDPNQLDPASVAPVIRIPHRDAGNHYGGRVMFGPGGMLYLSTGDGGGGDNQFMHAQNTTSFLGKMLRVDVSALDANISANKVPPYDIPADNPTWGTPQPSEIWAIGLRNPFRPAFDGTLLYVADVGQSAREEVDVVDASAGGLNYGWSIMEGTVCRAIGGPCNTPGLTGPVYDYDHNQGECAIIGGYVYRGTAMPGRQGTYFFSDLCTGWLRGLTLDPNGAATVVQAPMANAGNPHSFGQDGAGELYMLTGDNRVLRLVTP